MAISPDPETDFLIKEGLHQKREVELGRKKLEDADALPPGTRIEYGRVIIPPSNVNEAIALFGAVLGVLGAIAKLVWHCRCYSSLFVRLWCFRS
jgi:hypothetical protein